jgi:hypothetical protein
VCAIDVRVQVVRLRAGQCALVVVDVCAGGGRGVHVRNTDRYERCQYLTTVTCEILLVSIALPCTSYQSRVRHSVRKSERI